MKPITSLKILGHVVTITRVPASFILSSNIGESDSGQGTIKIVDGLEKSVYEATLLHETFHIIDKHLDLGLTEDQVSGLAQGLFQVLRDNPRFMR